MKILTVTMIITLMLATVGCGNQQEELPTSTPEIDVPVTTPVEDVEETVVQPSDTKDEVVYDNWSRLGDKSIYVNYKSGRRKDEGLSSLVYHSNKTDMIALHYNLIDEFTGGTEDVFDFLNNGVVFCDVASYAEASLYSSDKAYDIIATSTQEVSFGDIDAIEITGYVMDANDRKCHVYGYTFLMDSTPCFLVGFVFTEEQEESMIAAIHEEVNGMMKTLRSEF